MDVTERWRQEFLAKLAGSDFIVSKEKIVKELRWHIVVNINL